MLNKGPKGGPLMASKIPENFFKKVQYLIIVPLRNILTVKIQEQDVDKILGKIFFYKSWK